MKRKRKNDEPSVHIVIDNTLEELAKVLHIWGGEMARSLNPPPMDDLERAMEYAEYQFKLAMMVAFPSHILEEFERRQRKKRRQQDEISSL